MASLSAWIRSANSVEWVAPLRVTPETGIRKRPFDSRMKLMPARGDSPAVIEYSRVQARVGDHVQRGCVIARNCWAQLDASIYLAERVLDHLVNEHLALARRQEQGVCGQIIEVDALLAGQGVPARHYDQQIFDAEIQGFESGAVDAAANQRDVGVTGGHGVHAVGKTLDDELDVQVRMKFAHVCDASSV